MSDMSAHEENHYKAIYRDAAYYSSGRDWNDYAPAYHYGSSARAQHLGQRFDDVEAELAANWDANKADSRLLWAEARGAARDAWQHFDSTIPSGARRRRDD
jgi:hypothetical protein